VTFSAGWGFLYRLLKSNSASRINAVILLDGMHTNDLGGCKDFAERAALGGPSAPFLVMAHSQIVPTYVSTKTTNTAIMQAAFGTGIQGVNLAPDYVTNAVLDKPVTCGNQYGRRTFTTDPLCAQDNVGNAWRLEYDGASAAEHIYIAGHVQPRLWRWLGEVWNPVNVSVSGAGESNLPESASLPGQASDVA
jgi:hypothetical protein